MTLDRKLKIIFGISSAGLMTTILINFPNGMILSGIFLGGMVIVGIIIGCLILSGLLILLFKKMSLLTLFFITTTIAFSAFQYQVYSPTLTIKVPNGYRGEIFLVLSNVKDNVLTVDSNGIGYLNERTFNLTYSRPIVEQIDGGDLDEYLIGFNPSTFFGKGNTYCVENRKIQSLSFKIGTKPHLENEYFQSKSLTEIVDNKKTIYTELDKHYKYSRTTIHSGK
jgi:hypothetical protein|tara:strand:- start:1135 stop:1806 length:672 start_codon:yes stop_codon:yes gene_type:complete